MTTFRVVRSSVEAVVRAEGDPRGIADTVTGGAFTGGTRIVRPDGVDAIFDTGSMFRYFGELSTGYEGVSSQPVMRKEINRLSEIDETLVGARLEFVTYRQMRSSGLAVAPSGKLHEVDLNVVLGLSTRIVDITWDRADLVEGLAVAFPEAAARMMARSFWM